MASQYPENFIKLKDRFPALVEAYERAGELGRHAGPLSEKTSHLIQLAACAALRSEGGVHSHTRRALEAGATKEELYHALVMLVSTIGFPTVAATFSWVNDIVESGR
jgi:AhpD family alkylhydroperoxidase